MSHITRRSLLGAGVATALTAACAPPSFAAPRWPGHVPGKCYLGMSVRGDLDAEVDRYGPLGVHRHYYQWHIGKFEQRRIAADHAADRMPWVSFQPPNGASSWRAIGDGQHDAAIRTRARAYARFNKPIIVTFHHEPAEEGRSGDLPQQFRRAWCRIHDVMRDETNLRNVVSVPIIGDYTFNPSNSKDDPDDWVRSDILSRCHFFGVDLYQNLSGDGLDVRLGRILAHLRRMGHPNLMLGLGEIGSTDRFGNPGAVEWWNDQWTWVSRNTDKVGVVSYYNSSRGAPGKPDWRLGTSGAMVRAFGDSLRSGTAARSMP